MLRVLTAVLVPALLAAPAVAGDTKVALTGENTKITFVGTKPGGKHEGGFKKVTGTATLQGTDVTTLKIAVEIDVNSMYTDVAKLTGHLKSADFFDVKAYPKANFTSTKVEKSGKGYTVTGSLTLCGKTKDLSFPATITAEGGLSLTSDFTINRNDWGISYGKGMINDTVSLKVSVKAK
jgi:polyisoprenoid-binding protein YceI